MRRLVLALLVVLVGAPVVSAKEPLPLAKYGLNSLRRMSDKEGNSVRGTAVTASGISSISAIFYDTTTGSRVNFDLVDFSVGTDPYCMTDQAAQNVNQIGVTGPLTITFPSGVTASISTFNAGGFSQGLVSSRVTPLTFTMPTNAAP